MRLSGRSLMYARNRQGPRTEPCGTPDLTGTDEEHLLVDILILVGSKLKLMTMSKRAKT